MDWDERLRLDLQYKNAVSFSLDFTIMLKTIGSVLSHKDVVVAGQYKMKRLDEERMELNAYQRAADR